LAEKALLRGPFLQKAQATGKSMFSVSTEKERKRTYLREQVSYVWGTKYSI